jgi:hypothetical protein
MERPTVFHHRQTGPMGSYFDDVLMNDATVISLEVCCRKGKHLTQEAIYLP